ncbi:hypothetical protein [Clostridium sp. HBUAS56017]|nr:hypothetical protein [Clostridium sp. HBUAS56017]
MGIILDILRLIEDRRIKVVEQKPFKKILSEELQKISKEKDYKDTTK